MMSFFFVSKKESSVTGLCLKIMRAAYHRMSYDQNHNIFGIHSKQIDKTLMNRFVSIFKIKMFVKRKT